MNELHFLTPKELKESRVFFELSLPNAFLWFIYGLAALLAAFFLWAALGRMEVIVRSPAVLQPLQNGSEIISPISGRVADKAVTNGQRVARGETLWTFQGADLLADKAATTLQLERKMKRLRELQNFVSAVAADGKAETPTEAGAQHLFKVYQSEYEALRLKALQARQAWEREAALPEAARVPSRLQDLETAALLAQNAWESYPSSRLTAASQETDSLLDAISALTQHAAALDKQIEVIQTCAPIDGFYEELWSFNAGDTIVAGTTVARIIPEKSEELKVVISLPSDDIAEIGKGMPFRLDFPKLPRSEYGQATGRIVLLPEDARFSAASTPFFKIEGSLDRNWLENSAGRRVDLKSGMTATAHIIVREKPLWRFILEKLDFIE